MGIESYPEYHIALNKFSAANNSRNCNDAEVRRRLRRYWHICAVLTRRMGKEPATPDNDTAVLQFFHERS